MTDDLQNKKYFMYAAPVQFMLSFSALPELKQQTDYPADMVKRVGNKETLENYRATIESFAKESNFETFWKSNEEFYNKILDFTVSDMAGADIVKAVEDYYNEKQNSYNIIISTLAYGSYGHKIEVSKNKYDIYSCTVTRDYKNEIPYLTRVALLRNAVHEFSHSFVNYLTEKYSQRVAASELLFQPIKSAMNQQAYGSWEECVNEHMVRAINIRIHELNWGKEISQKMQGDEKANQFIYIEPILNKLKEFEAARNKNNITFSEFYPKFLDLFDSLKTKQHKKKDIMAMLGLKKQVTSNSTFSGPINAAFNYQMTFILPTHDSTGNLSIVQEFASLIVNNFKNKNVKIILLQDTVAVNTDLSNSALMVFGTIESNLFLSKYKSTFPFKIENNTIIADKVYQEEGTRIITCLPNPQNPQYGMIIHTAISNKYINHTISKLSNIKPGDDDYVIFNNQNIVYAEGHYIKTGKWKFY
jgi:hypothetical protein